MRRIRATVAVAAFALLVLPAGGRASDLAIESVDPATGTLIDYVVGDQTMVDGDLSLISDQDATETDAP